MGKAGKEFEVDVGYVLNLWQKEVEEMARECLENRSLVLVLGRGFFTSMKQIRREILESDQKMAAVGIRATSRFRWHSRFDCLVCLGVQDVEEETWEDFFVLALRKVNRPGPIRSTRRNLHSKTPLIHLSDHRYFRVVTGLRVI